MRNKKKKIEIKNTATHGETWQTINRGKPTYYQDIKHWIVYEFDDNILISRNEDLTAVFCVKKNLTHH